MNAATLTTGRAPFAIAFLLSLVAVSPAHADTLTLMWDPNPEQVNGYVVYAGAQSSSLTQRSDVGNTTTFTLTTAVAGQQYCFAVAAYFDPATEGPRSTAVCGYSNQYPTLSNPGNQSSTAGQAVSLQLVGSDPDGQAISYTASGLPPGLTLGSSNGFISGVATTAGSYSVTARVSDGVLTSAAQSFTWSVASSSTADTTSPSVSITGPTSAATYTSSASSVLLSGTATDNVGVSAVTWANDRGGSGTATGTTGWSAPSIALQVGTNVITVTARDAAGNRGTDVLTVTYTAPDTTAPTVSITGPTTSSTFSTSATSLTISGIAADAVGVTQVSWVNDLGGAGTASGTTSWSVTGIDLKYNTNTITVTARDAAGNQSTDVLAVTYTPADTSAPTVSIVGPTTAASYATTSSVVTLGGTAADNLGVTAVSWANDRGGSGFSSGTTSWSVPSVSLQSGTNVITVAAQDAAGNRGTDVLTVSYTPPDTTAPTVSIASPTTSSTFTASSGSLTIGGTAADAVGVTQVGWVNDRGGAGTASGTTTWSVPSVALQTGTNVITVTARDASGNQSTDALTVTYSAPVPEPSPSIVLSADFYSSGRWKKVLLRWTLVSGRYVDIYRDGVRLTRTNNDGSYTDAPRGVGPFSYYVCVSGTTVCSNTVVVSQ